LYRYAERHIQQLMDKVQTKEEAEMAAKAIARWGCTS
jgi:hypothetical protein